MAFDIMDHPICLSYPERTTESAWTLHVPIAMLLIDLLRPAQFVELGTHTGLSYCAFCQAVKELGTDTQCFAVDTWHGEGHSGVYGAEVLDHLRAHHDPRYHEFSRLIQSTFDDAVAGFADGSIDLLHIDGYHTYEAVSHDFYTWLPKMSDRGVVVLHDTNERERDFGVWKLWDELKQKYPSFEVLHGHGLGIVAVGSQVPEELRGLIEADDSHLAALRQFFHEMGMRIESREEAELQHSLLLQEKHISDDLQAQIEEAHDTIQKHMAHIDSQHEYVRVKELQVDLILGSRYWRMGKPVRKVARVAKKGVRLLRKVAGNPSAASATKHHKAVMFVSGCPGDAKRYRCDHQAEQLELLGCTYDIGMYGEVDFGDLVERYQLFILHRVPYDSSVEWFIQKAHHLGKTVIFETDDLVFDPEAAKYVAALEDMSQSERDLYIDGLKRYRKTLLLCDAVLVSTESLRDEAKRIHDNVIVMPNVVSQEMVRGAEAALLRKRSRRERRSDGTVVIVYMSGTRTHNRDFLEAADAILWVLANYPNARFKAVGHLDLDPRFDQFRDRVERIPLQRWQDLPNIYADVDINLAPLEPDNPFTEAKSCLKYIEAGLLGLPTIASSRTDFRRVIKHNVNGLLADTPGEWRDGLCRLVESADLRRQLGHSAYEDVRQNSTSVARAESFFQALQFILKSTNPSNEPKTLTINWILRAPIANTGGGYRTIFRLANHLGAVGHKVRVYVEPIAHLEGYSNRQVQTFVDTHFGPLNVEVQTGHGDILPADISIATNWPTAYPVAKHTESMSKFYFVQDYEPDFYQSNDHKYEQAKRTYTLPLMPICIGSHLGKRITQVTNKPVEVMDFAIDSKTFHLKVSQAERAGPIKVLFFARPGLKRRGYDLGIQSLRQVKNRHPEVEIMLFGSTDREIGSIPFEATNLGVLSSTDLADVLNKVHILLCFSFSNISWVPFEGMACGAAVVEANVPSVKEMVQEGYTCLLADPNADAVASTVMRLIEDENLRATISSNAVQEMLKHTWEHSADQFEQILLRHSL